MVFESTQAYFSGISVNLSQCLRHPNVFGVFFFNSNFKSKSLLLLSMNSLNFPLNLFRNQSDILVNSICNLQLVSCHTHHAFHCISVILLNTLILFKLTGYQFRFIIKIDFFCFWSHLLCINCNMNNSLWDFFLYFLSIFCIISVSSFVKLLFFKTFAFYSNGIIPHAEAGGGWGWGTLNQS